VSASNAVQHFAELVSEDRLLRSDFYNGFIRKTELFHGLGAALPHGDRVGMIAFHRPRGANIFADEEQQLMLTILPHLTRLLQIRARLNDAELLQGTLEQSLQTLGFGVIVIDALNRIVFANRLGEAALRDGPLRHSTVAGLSATTMQENIRLKTVVAQALQRRGPAAGSVRLSRPAGGADLQMTVAPLRPADRSGQEMAMLLLADPGSPDPGLAPRLQQMFGLSKTEALLFALLAQGATVDEVARDRGVGVSTVRSQVRTLFQKTGVSRQGALISLATALPRIHEPG
jgi:DNA-binding CsgD family transcriptional regulator/PAS domain-containing protein